MVRVTPSLEPAKAMIYQPGHELGPRQGPGAQGAQNESGYEGNVRISRTPSVKEANTKQ